MFAFYHWPFPHTCTLQRLQPIGPSIGKLILGSVFSDCGVHLYARLLHCQTYNRKLYLVGQTQQSACCALTTGSAQNRLWHPTSWALGDAAITMADPWGRWGRSSPPRKRTRKIFRTSVKINPATENSLIPFVSSACYVE